MSSHDVATDPTEGSFLSDLLKPGSSLQGKYLLALDVAFALLLCVLLSLAYLTAGNVHIFILIGIELCLWASVKWFIAELKAVKAQEVKKDT